MMLQWMAYAALCAALLAAAAACIERVCAIQGRARRGVWITAIVLSVIIPIASPLIARNISGAAPAFVAGVPFDAATARAVQPAQIDIIALSAWATASLLFVTLLLVAHWRTSRVLRGCRRGTIAGRPAFISRDFGPAVVGVFRHHIVVPGWVLDLGDTEQQFVVMHELEHARSADPLVALAGVCSVVAMPWNVALWWQLSRLRLAIELDCDARVVARKQSNVVAYGQLLLCVRERGHASRHPVLAMSRSRSSLAKRLDALLDRRTRRQPAQLIGLATLALGIATSVAFIPAPHVQTVIEQLRNARVDSPRASAAGMLRRGTPQIARATVPPTAGAPARSIIKQRSSVLRKTPRSDARVGTLAEATVPPMSVVPSNPLGDIAPATASRVVIARGGFVRAGGGARSGGAGRAILRAAPSAAVGRGGVGGFQADPGRGVQPVPTTGSGPDSLRGGVIRAVGGRAAAARPDTTQRPPR